MQWVSNNWDTLILKNYFLFIQNSILIKLPVYSLAKFGTLYVMPNSSGQNIFKSFNFNKIKSKRCLRRRKWVHWPWQHQFSLSGRILKFAKSFKKKQRLKFINTFKHFISVYIIEICKVWRHFWAFTFPVPLTRFESHLSKINVNINRYKGKKENRGREWLVVACHFFLFLFIIILPSLECLSSFFSCVIM